MTRVESVNTCNVLVEVLFALTCKLLDHLVLADPTCTAYVQNHVFLTMLHCHRCHVFLSKKIARRFVDMWPGPGSRFHFEQVRPASDAAARTKMQ